MNGGGPAFARTLLYEDADGALQALSYSTMAGLSARDYFAAHAPSDVINNYIPESLAGCFELCDKLGIDRKGDADWRGPLFAWARYKSADDMLKERGRK